MPRYWGSDPNNPSNPATPASKKKLIIAGCIGLVALCLIIGLSVGLTNNKGGSSGATTSGNSVTPATGATGAQTIVDENVLNASAPTPSDPSSTPTPKPVGAPTSQATVVTPTGTVQTVAPLASVSQDVVYCPPIEGKTYLACGKNKLCCQKGEACLYLASNGWAGTCQKCDNPSGVCGVQRLCCDSVSEKCLVEHPDTTFGARRLRGDSHRRLWEGQCVPSDNCSAIYEQCGGIEWSGPTCCQGSGNACVVQLKSDGAPNLYYSQCLPISAPTVCQPLYSQCGGIGFTGQTCCLGSENSCQVQVLGGEVNLYYSQCLPLPSGSCMQRYDQCGGANWTGPTCCQRADDSCQVQILNGQSNLYYSQCLPAAPSVAPTSLPPTEVPIPTQEITPAPSEITPEPTDVPLVALNMTVVFTGISASQITVDDLFVIRLSYALLLNVDVSRVVITSIVDGSVGVGVVRRRLQTSGPAITVFVSTLGTVPKDRTQRANDRGAFSAATQEVVGLYAHVYSSLITKDSVAEVHGFEGPVGLAPTEDNVCSTENGNILFKKIGRCDIPIAEKGGCPAELPLVNSVLNMCYAACNFGYDYNSVLNRCYKPCTTGIYNEKIDTCIDPDMCTDGKTYDDDENTCRCTDGTLFFPVTGQCEDRVLCPSADTPLLTTYNPVRNECYNNDITLCPPPRIINLDTGLCECPCARAYDAVSNSCAASSDPNAVCAALDECPTDQFANTLLNVCHESCYPGKYNRQRDECYDACSIPKLYYDRVTRQCLCPPETVWFAVLNECETVAQCQAGEGYNELLNQCYNACPASRPVYNQILGQCVIECTEGELYNGVYQRCYTPCTAPEVNNLYYAQGDICYDPADCLPPNAYNSVTNTCELKAACSTALIDGPLMNYNVVRNECYSTCPEGQQYNALLNDCHDPADCPLPRKYQIQTGTCECPCGRTFFEGECAVYGDYCPEIDDNPPPAELCFDFIAYEATLATPLDLSYCSLGDAPPLATSTVTVTGDVTIFIPESGVTFDKIRFVVSDGASLAFEGGPATFKNNIAPKVLRFPDIPSSLTTSSTSSTFVTDFYGGGAIVVGLGSTLTLNNDCEFTDNKTVSEANEEIHGGAIENFGTIVTNGKVTFTQNSSKSGGAVWSSGSCEFNGVTEFVENISEDDGGAVYSKGDCTFTDTVSFTSNKSRFGAGFASESGVVTFEQDVVFDANEATEGGGALAVLYGTVAFKAGLTLTNNKSKRGSGFAVGLEGFTGLGTIELTLDPVLEGNELPTFRVAGTIKTCAVLPEAEIELHSNGAVIVGLETCILDEENFDERALVGGVVSLTCANNPCGVLGQCADVASATAAYTCSTCGPGLFLKNAVCKDINSCAGSPCGATKTGGVCIDTVAPQTGYVCTACSSEKILVGTVCPNKIDCSSNPCGVVPAGDCVNDLIFGHSCKTCGTGFDYIGIGSFCFDKNECEGQPCGPYSDGGVCVDTVAPGTGYTCTQCSTGLTLDSVAGTCTAVDPCLADPCHGGQCVTAGVQPTLTYSCGGCGDGFALVGGLCIAFCLLSKVVTTVIAGCGNTPATTKISHHVDDLTIDGVWDLSKCFWSSPPNLITVFMKSIASVILPSQGLEMNMVTFDTTGATSLEFIGGPGAVKFSGSAGFRNGVVFSVLAGQTLTFQMPVIFYRNKQSLLNGQAPYVGGAFYSEGVVTFLSDAEFTENTAAGGAGFAVQGAGSVHFAGTFSCTGNIAGNYEGGGGCILSSGPSITFDKSATFSGNSASNGGAAITTSGDLTFKAESTFDQNSSVQGGGAVSILAGSSKFHGKATFNGNTNTSTDKAVGAALTTATTVDFYAAASFTENVAGRGGVATIGGPTNFHSTVTIGGGVQSIPTFVFALNQGLTYKVTSCGTIAGASVNVEAPPNSLVVDPTICLVAGAQGRRVQEIESSNSTGTPVGDDASIQGMHVSDKGHLTLRSRSIADDRVPGTAVGSKAE